MKYSILIILAACLAMTSLQGQDTGLPGEEVDIVKEFNARLGEANRVLLQPELPPLRTETPILNYQIDSRVLNVQYLPPRIRPIALDRVD